MHHQIACFHVLVAMTATVQKNHFASHILPVTKITHLCVELVSITPLYVNTPAHQVVVVNVLLVNHALPIQHVVQIQAPMHPYLFLDLHTFVANRSLMQQLSAHSRVLQGWIRSVQVVKNASPILNVTVRIRTFVVRVWRMHRPLVNTHVLL